MQTYTVKLLDRKMVADNTIGLYLERPAGFEYKAGQFIQLGTIDPPYTDAKGPKRPLSLASSPTENQLIVAMRLSDSAFKRTVNELPIGADMTVMGPLGHLVLPEGHEKRIIMIGGGVGIVPFRSMVIADAAAEKPHGITLLFGNRYMKEATFHEEFEMIQHPDFVYVPSCSRDEEPNKDWTGERGRIDAAMIERHVQNIPDHLYYIVGLTNMVKSIKAQLLLLGVPKEQIKVELYGNY